MGGRGGEHPLCQGVVAARGRLRDLHGGRIGLGHRAERPCHNLHPARVRDFQKKPCGSGGEGAFCTAVDRRVPCSSSSRAGEWDDDLLLGRTCNGWHLGDFPLFAWSHREPRQHGTSGICRTQHGRRDVAGNPGRLEKDNEVARAEMGHARRGLDALGAVVAWTLKDGEVLVVGFSGSRVRKRLG